MTRMHVVFVLLAALVASALLQIHLQYQVRQYYSALSDAQLHARQLEAERERLRLEKRLLTKPENVAVVARDKLGMRTATAGVTHYVEYRAADAAVPAAPVEAQP